jgi:hypothetical protein
MYISNAYVTKHNMHRHYNLRPRTKSLPLPATKPLSPWPQCSICLAFITQKKNLAILPCNHKVHTSCFTEWVIKSQKTTCPVCRHKACAEPKRTEAELPWCYDEHTRDETILTRPPLLVQPDDTIVAMSQLEALWPGSLGFLCPLPHKMNEIRDTWLELFTFHLSFVSLCNEIPGQIPFRTVGENSEEIDAFLECCQSSVVYALAQLPQATLSEGRRMRARSDKKKSQTEAEMHWLDIVFSRDSDCAPGTTMAARLNFLVAGMSRAMAHKEGSLQERIRRYPYSYICSGAAVRLLAPRSTWDPDLPQVTTSL